MSPKGLDFKEKERLKMRMRMAFKGMNPRVKKVHENIKNENEGWEIGILVAPSLGLIVHKVLEEGVPKRKGMIKVTDNSIEVYGKVPKHLIDLARYLSDAKISEGRYVNLRETIRNIYLYSRGSLRLPGGGIGVMIPKEEIDLLTRTLAIEKEKLLKILGGKK